MMQGYKVNVIPGGEFAENALLYQQPSPELINYINQNMQHVYEQGDMYSDMFKTTLQNMYDANLSQQALNNAQMLLSQAGTVLSENTIYEVPEDQLPYANYIMQQYIMAQPDLNLRYKRNMCHGYAETYFNYEPDTWGEDRTEYKRVMDGILQFDENGEGYFVHYSTDDEVELTFNEQVSVLNTWRNVRNKLLAGIDPTDPEFNM